MKNLRRFLPAALLALALLLTACGFGSLRSNCEIDLGSSALFSERELEQAVPLIQQEFDTWRGCELHSIRYAGDYSCSEENLQWLNLIRTQDEPFVDCALFLSDFHTPLDPGQEDGWNPDYEYLNWQWWLGRTADGTWFLVTWGY